MLVLETWTDLRIERQHPGTHVQARAESSQRANPGLTLHPEIPFGAPTHSMYNSRQEFA